LNQPAWRDLWFSPSERASLSFVQAGRTGERGTPVGPQSFFYQKTAVAHPFLQSHYPSAYRFLIAGAQAEAMSARRVDVQFRWNAGVFES